MAIPNHRSVTLGIELEAYTIRVPEYRIGREMAFPRRGAAERGERFARDSTIGTEYNSRPFSTIREGLFALHAGLRKYGRTRYRHRSQPHRGHEILLVGGWRDRYAGAHIHLALADRELDKPLAARLAWHLHDHIPFLIALGANSPVWQDELTDRASNRVARASSKYFRPLKRGELFQRSYDEMLWSRARNLKPATLEIRVLDSNLPEFVLMGACVVKAVALNWLARRPAANRVRASDYLKSRKAAAERGTRAELCWNGEWVSVPRYLDKFVWEHRDVLDEMDIPEEVWIPFKLLKRRINGATLLGAAAAASQAEQPRAWQRAFARRYVAAIGELLAGNTLVDFADQLGVGLPDLERVWLGRRNLDLA